MRKFLNNPAVVLPLACIALLWVGYSYGLTNHLLRNFGGQTTQETTRTARKTGPLDSSTRSEKAMVNLIAERWLVSGWVRSTVAKNEPFVADSFQTKAELPAEIAAPEIEEEKTVIVDRETFQAALVSKLGLDKEGFFVVFENVLNQPVRKRVGDLIYIEDSGPLVIPTFGIAEKKRSAEEIQVYVESIVKNFKLLGVGTEEAANAESSHSESSMNIAFIELTDGRTEIFKQGDLVLRDPHLGLDKVIKGIKEDSVVLVDQYSNEYSLKSGSEKN
jgi:hypothetical protein